MSSGEPRPHSEMMRLAVEVARLLAPYCTRIAVAGSLRRGKAMVGDIEIVCAPDFQPLPSGRKGFIQVRQDAVNWKCDRLREEEIFTPKLNLQGNPEAWAERHKLAFYKGVKLDLYIVQPDRSWGYTMLLRTGPGDANGVLVTKQGVRNRDGNLGILPAGYQFREGELWRDEFHLPTPEEKDVFAALDLPYIAPPLRSVQMYQLWRNRKRQTPHEFWKRYGGEQGLGSLMVMSSMPAGFGDDVWVNGRQRFLNIKVGLSEQGKERIAS